MLYLEYLTISLDLIWAMATFFYKLENFHDNIEKVQYKDVLAITGAIQGTSREKIFDGLGLHSLTIRR